MNIPVDFLSTRRLVEGYLEKSPPPNTSGLRWMLSCGREQSGILRKRWRKRYFVLLEVKKRHQTEIFLQYYKDRECKKFKGRVDLQNCKCIINNVVVDGKSNVFSLETDHRGRRRVYCFAATSDKIMVDWVDSLVRAMHFEDTAPDEPRAPGALGTPGLLNRAVPPYLSPLPPPLTTTQPPPVSSRPCLGMPRDGSAVSSCPSKQRSEVIGCDSVLTPEMDYQLTVPEHDQDGYYKLLDVSHSYVNLSTSAEGKKDEHAEVSDRLKSSDFEQCPALPVRMKQNVKQPSKAKVVDGIHEECTGDDNAGRHSDSPYELCPDETSAPSNEHRKSTNSVYLTVWDSSDQELDLSVPSGSHIPPPIVPRNPAGSSKSGAVPCAVRLRDTVISDYQELPSIDAPLTLAPPPPSQSIPKTYVVPPPIPVKPASLKHITKPAVMTHTLLSVGNCNQLPQVEPCIPLRNSEKASFFEAGSDVVLPVRTVTSNASEDSSSASALDDDDDEDEDEYSDPLSTQAALPERPSVGAGQQTAAADQPSLLSPHPASVPPVATVPRPVFPSPTKNTPGSLVFTSVLPPQPLNYIEPCNLELGLLNGHGSGARSTHHSNGSTVVTTSGSKLVGSTDPSRHIRTAGEESTHHVKLGDQFIVSPHPQGRTQTTLTLSPVSNSDERIEYKEIDPLGTRALEAVSKHF